MIVSGGTENRQQYGIRQFDRICMGRLWDKEELCRQFLSINYCRIDAPGGQEGMR